VIDRIHIEQLSFRARIGVSEAERAKSQRLAANFTFWPQVRADLKDRISHFKAMEESLQNTLVLAQRTADEVKASAHKEADLIKEQARITAQREIASFTDAAQDARREHQRLNEAAEKARGELRSLLMTHMALLEKITPQPNGELPASEPSQDTTRVDLTEANRITVY